MVADTNVLLGSLTYAWNSDIMEVMVPSVAKLARISSFNSFTYCYASTYHNMIISRQKMKIILVGVITYRIVRENEEILEIRTE
jgi:hypothetical protein